MSCTKHFFSLEWEHHSWHRRVSSTESVSFPLTDMWGRVVSDDLVRCHTEEVCDAGGATRGGGECLCDAPAGERCEVRLACVETPRRTTA